MDSPRARPHDSNEVIHCEVMQMEWTDWPATSDEEIARSALVVAPTLDERVILYLRALHGDREFAERERANAREVLLDAMAAEIAGEVE
jgi:hypothetical protein